MLPLVHEFGFWLTVITWEVPYGTIRHAEIA